MSAATQRRIAAGFVVAGLVVAGVAAASIGVASGRDDNTIAAVGDFEFEPNKEFVNTFRFAPGKIKVPRGTEITFVNETGFDEQHTLTIVDEEELPETIDELFACTACELASGHFDENFTIIQPRLDVGDPGLDTRGDSLAVGPRGSADDTITANVTAPKGTRLPFLCAVHPWMQGSIKVNGKEDDG